jgi:hypothetical protein
VFVITRGERGKKKTNKRIPPKVEELLFSCGIPDCFDFFWRIFVKIRV